MFRYEIDTHVVTSRQCRACRDVRWRATWNLGYQLSQSNFWPRHHTAASKAAQLTICCLIYRPWSVRNAGPTDSSVTGHMQLPITRGRCPHINILQNSPMLAWELYSGADSMGNGGHAPLPHFYKWLGTWGTVSRRTANKKQNCTDHHESAHQND